MEGKHTMENANEDRSLTRQGKMLAIGIIAVLALLVVTVFLSGLSVMPEAQVIPTGTVVMTATPGS